MPKIEYNGIDFDSEEERLFYLYLLELQEAGWVKEFTFHVDEFVLSAPVKYKWIKELKTKKQVQESTLLQGHVYSPDYRIFWENRALGKFYINIFDNLNKIDEVPFINNINADGTDAGTYIEVKPSFDMNNMQRLFAINQKWVFKDYGILVQKIIPIGKPTCLFAKTFVPKEAMLTNKTKQPKKYKFVTKSLDEFLND
jgi:hypothetical protein